MSSETSTAVNITTTTSSSCANHSRRRTVQNFLLVWLDASIDESNKDYRDMLKTLRNIVNDVYSVTQSNECLEFFKKTDVEKIFVIASGYLGQYLIPDIHTLPQLDTVYIFCDNKTRHEQWAKNWKKIKGVYTEIASIYQDLEQAVKQSNLDSISMSFVPMGEVASSQNLDQLEPTFIYTKILKEILLKMEFGPEYINKLVDYSRELYRHNKDELAIINEFQLHYNPQLSIWWYTRECFTYHMLNRALGTLDTDNILHMSFFLRDLHKRIEELHSQQTDS